MAPTTPHLTEEPIVLPFVVLIDTNEGTPWTFQGLRGDAKERNRPINILRKYQSLGRYPSSRGDYSIEGHTEMVAIERKSMVDAQGTILGWPSDHESTNSLDGRRERFECELSNLNRIPFSIVIVEATLEACLENMPSYGVKSEDDNRKIFWRSVMSYQQRFPSVQWMFAHSVNFAEEYAIWWFRRYWRKYLEASRTELEI
jgi:hypothetical protein